MEIIQIDEFAAKKLLSKVGQWVKPNNDYLPPQISITFVISLEKSLKFLITIDGQ